MSKSIFLNHPPNPLLWDGSVHGHTHTYGVLKTDACKDIERVREQNARYRRIVNETRANNVSRPVNEIKLVIRIILIVY